MFLLLPFIIWMFDTSVTSEFVRRFTRCSLSVCSACPGFVFKLVALLLIWAFLHHLIAGVRHLWMDMTHAVDLRFGRSARSRRWC